MPKAPSIFITAPTVASLIGFANAAAFRRKRDELEQDYNFPLPMPAVHPMKWRRSEVEAWARCYGVSRAEMHAAKPLPTPKALMIEAGRP